MKKSSVWLPVLASVIMLGYTLYDAIRFGFMHPLDYILAGAALIIAGLLIRYSVLAAKKERLQNEIDAKDD